MANYIYRFDSKITKQTYCFFFSIIDNDDEFNSEWQIKENEFLQWHAYVINSSNTKKINFVFNHEGNSKIHIHVNCVANGTSNTTISLTNKISGNATNVESAQIINGVLLDSNSQITVMPNYAIKNNVVVVSHEVNIGHIDNEKIFYMQAKGISKNDAIKIIINSMFAPIASTNINDIELNILFNSMKEKIQELLAL